jgi:hypothetical protein
VSIDKNMKYIKFYGKYTNYTLEDFKWCEFNKLKLYKNIEPDTNIVKPFIINTLFDIFLSSKSALFVNINDIENI